jgi:hypothetical protein
MPDPHIRVPRARAVRIHQEGAEVVLLLDGQVAFRAHWRYALELANGLRNRAAAAEQFERVATQTAAASTAPQPKIVSVFGIPLFRRKP